MNGNDGGLFLRLVEEVVAGAQTLQEAEDLDTYRAAEVFVDQLRIDIRDALALLLSCGVLPEESAVYRITPGLTPGYQAGVKKAAEVCLIQAAVAQMNGGGS